MAIKSGQSNYDPTPNNTSESPYRDSVEVDVTQSSVPPPSYGSIPNSNREDHRTFDAGQEESHYWNRLHKKTKLRKIFHFLLATLILGSLLYFLLSLGRHDKGTTHYAPPPSPPSTDGKLSQKPTWTSPSKIPIWERPISNLESWSKEASFSLPISAPFLFLHAQGSHFGGNIAMGLSDDGKGSDQIEVKIKAIYSDEELLNTVSIGKLVGQDGKEGVGLYQSQDFDWKIWNEFVNFEIKVILPFNKKADLMAINYWETKVDNLSLDVGPLEGGAIFKNAIKLESKNGAIQVRSIESQNSINISTQNGAIASSGSLKSPNVEVTSSNGRLGFQQILSSTLKLESKNGAVACLDCNSPVQSIRSRSGHLEGTYSVSKSLQLHSNAGAIKANVKVLKLDEEIKVEASSDAGNVSLNYLEQAKGTKLNSSALSKAGKVQVQHAGNFVGNWKLKTDVGSANVDDQITDNDHRLKIDRVEKKITSQLMEGRCWWGSLPKEPSSNWGISTLTSSVGSVSATFI